MTNSQVARFFVPTRSHRWNALAATALLLIATSTGTAAAAVPPKVPPCPKGQVRITIVTKTSCVLLGKALPAAPPTQTAGSFIVGTALGGRLDRLERKAFPPTKEEAAVPNAGLAGGSALAPGIETMAKLARGPAAGRRVGVPLLTAVAVQQPRLDGGWSAPQTSTSSTSNATTIVATTTRSIDGTTGTLTATGVIPNQSTGVPDESQATMEMGLKIDSPNSGAFSIAVTLGTSDKVKTTGPCPDAAGRIDVSANTTLGVKTAQEATAPGLEYIRKNTTISTNSSFVATVAPDAYLESTSFNISETVHHTYAASVLGGRLPHTYAMTITAHATGTVNGRTGAVSVASLQIDGTGTMSGVSNAAATAAVRSAVQSDKIWGEILARLAADAHERLKEAEKIWREPNKCVDMRFAPPTGAKLASGAKLGVDGKLVAKRDGKPTTALWKPPRVSRGSLVGPWPGTSLPSNPLHFVAKGTAPDAAGKTFALTASATSRAGLASGPWDGTAGGWRVTISGPVSGDQGFGVSLASTVKAVVDVRLVTRGGESRYYGSAPFSYTAPSVTQPTVAVCVPPGATAPTIPVYAFTSVSGTADVLITPETTAVLPQIKVNLSMGDKTVGTMTCPESGPAPAESLLVGLNAFTYPQGATITLPAKGGTTSVNWSGATPVANSGALTVKIEAI